MDLLRRTLRRDDLEEAPAAVVFGDGGRIVFVGRHSDPHGIRPVVIARLQPPSTPVACAFSSRGPGLEVEHRVTRRAEPASGEARHHVLEGKLVVQHRVEPHILGGQDAVQGHGLDHGAREAVEQEPSAATQTAKALPHQAEHCRVGGQLSAAHLLEGSRERRSVIAGGELGCGPKQVAR